MYHEQDASFMILDDILFLSWIQCTSRVVLGCPRKLVSGLYPQYTPFISGLYILYNPLILTIDPNFQRDIQVGKTCAFCDRSQESFQSTASTAAWVSFTVVALLFAGRRVIVVGNTCGGKKNVSTAIFLWDSPTLCGGHTKTMDTTK